MKKKFLVEKNKKQNMWSKLKENINLKTQLYYTLISGILLAYSSWLMITLSISIEFNAFLFFFFITSIALYVYFIKTYPKKSIINYLFYLLIGTIIFFVLNFIIPPMLMGIEFLRIIKSFLFFFYSYNTVYSFLLVFYLSFLCFFTQFLPSKFFKTDTIKKGYTISYIKEVIFCWWLFMILFPPIIYILAGIRFFEINF